MYILTIYELESKADKKEKGNIFYLSCGMFISVSRCLAVLLAVQVSPLTA